MIDETMIGWFLVILFASSFFFAWWQYRRAIAKDLPEVRSWGSAMLSSAGMSLVTFLSVANLESTAWNILIGLSAMVIMGVAMRRNWLDMKARFAENRKESASCRSLP